MQHKHCAGLSVVEALVAMVILLITLGGVYQIFQSNSLTYRMQEGLARVQENGRFAMDFLVSDIRMAGYLGCVSSNVNVVNTLNTSDYIYDFQTGIYGFDAQNGTWNTTVDSSIVDPLSGSDILTIRGFIGSGVHITESMPIVSADLKTDPVPSGVTPPVTDFDIVLISDCTTNAAIFQITNYTLSNGNLVHNTGVGVPGNSTKNLGHKYQEGAEIQKITSVSYFLSENGFGVPSLYRKIGSEAKQELVEGVENLQLLYGVDTDNDRNIDAYVDASSVSDWAAVRSVKIGLLVRNVDEIRGLDSNAELYDVLDTSVGPANDRRVRRVFTATVGLRNRLK